MRVFITWIVGIALNLQIGAASWAAQSYQIPPTASQMAARFSQAFEAARETIDPVHYDVDARAAALDYEVSAAAAFVTERIAYDAYAGVLRGPEGTLSTQAGSAWDQAITLSALINAMGGEALLVVGALKEEDAARLLLQTFAKREALTQAVDEAAITAAIKPYIPQDVQASARRSQQQATVAGASAEAATIITQAASNIQSALKGAGIDMATAADIAPLRTQIAADYVWVQYRDTPRDPWTSVHPAFGKDTAPDVTPERYITGSVPDDKIHKISVDLAIERFQNGALKRLPIMARYERPAANQAGKQIGLSIGPSGPAAQPGQDPSFFVPLMNDVLPKGAQAFTALGLTAPAEDALGGPEIFATVGNRFGGALTALDQPKQGETPTVGLAGIILTVRHVAPGGRTVTIERRLSDLRPDAPRKPGGIAEAIVFDGVIDVDVGAENMARDYRSFFTSQAERIAQLPQLAALNTSKMTLNDYLTQADTETPPGNAWGDITLFGSIFEPQARGAAHVVRQGPFVAMRRIQQDVNANGLLKTVIDIMHQPAVGFKNAGGKAVLDRTATLAQGIRETVMEGVLIGNEAEDSWVTAPIGQVVQTKAALEDAMASLSITEGMRERMRADLALSGTLAFSAADGPLRWWRIDAQTGQALGMSYHGGAELSEYAQTVTSVAGLLIAGVFAVKGGLGCQETYKDEPKMELCCHAGNALLFGVGVATGGKAGGWLAGNMKNAANAAVGYFVAMMTWELGADITAATVGGEIANGICAKIVK